MRKGTYVNTDDRFVGVYDAEKWLFQGVRIFVRELNNPICAIHSSRISDATSQKKLDLHIMESLFVLEYHISERGGYENNKS